jgi:hypothetical protein
VVLVAYHSASAQDDIKPPSLEIPKSGVAQAFPADAAIPSGAADARLFSVVAAEEALATQYNEAIARTRGPQDISLFREAAPSVVLILAKDSLGTGSLLQDNVILTNLHVVAPAGAMTGLDFLQAYDKSVSEEADAMEPLVRQFVREGYRNVPDWSLLGVLTRKLILEKGYRDKDVADIAKEAAIAHGMSK